MIILIDIRLSLLRYKTHDFCIGKGKQAKKFMRRDMNSISLHSIRTPNKNAGVWKFKPCTLSNFFRFSIFGVLVSLSNI